MIGQTISHYKILEKIGEGGMGVVYKAQDTKLDRIVALKFLPPQISINKDEKKRFIHEAKAAAALDHSNICTVHEIGETDDGQMFLVMPCYEGETLKDKIASGPLSLAQSLDIAIQIANGLEIAHEANIIHRDIKSANIFITKRNEVKILDFGVAKLKGQTKLTKEDSTLGTIDYMSPEQAEGSKVDQRSDIWSLGVVLYEMITGQLPFRGDYEQAIIYSIMNEEPEPVTGLRTGVPVELERIINKMMAIESAERYQGISDLLVDLKKVKQDSKLEISTGKKKTKPEITLRASRKFLITTGLIIIAILTMVQLIWKPFFKKAVLPQEKIGIAVVYFENHTRDRTLDHLKLVIPNLLITSLEQSKYFSVMTWERMRDLLKQMGKKKVELIDKDLGFELCRREGIKNMVVGSYIKLGKTIVTDVKVMDVETKELINSASSRGNGEQSILDTQIDELSHKISHAAGLSKLRTRETMKPVREVTTNSMEAYQYYLRGREEMGKWSYEEAVKFLEKAVEIDPTFTMAHIELGYAYRYNGNIKASNQAIKKAKKFSEKVTVREKLWIEFYYSALTRDQTKRMSVLKRITKEYPKDKGAHSFLGAMYRTQYDYDEAIVEFNRALKLDPSSVSVLLEIVYTYTWRGNFEKAIEAVNRAAAISPGNPMNIFTFGIILFHMGKLDEAIDKFKVYSEIKPNEDQTYIAYIEAIKENYAEAINRIDKYIYISSSQASKGLGYFWKGFYSYWLGCFQQALIDLDRAKNIAKEVDDKYLRGLADLLQGWIYYDRREFEQARRYYKSWHDIYIQIPIIGMVVSLPPEITAQYRFFKGVINLKEGRIKSTKSRLNEMKSSLSEVRQGFIKELIRYWYNLIMAEVFLIEGKPEMAIAMCKNFSSVRVRRFFIAFRNQIYNMPYIHDTLARAYVMNGEMDEAIAEYEKLTIFNPASKDRRLIHPRYHYRLAKLYQQKGLSQKAIISYNKFIKFWKDCDPLFQSLVEDARNRVEELNINRIKSK